MEQKRLISREGGLWVPPPARWFRYQGKEQLRHPNAIRHVVDRAAASAWEHVPSVFRPFIAARLDCLWLKAGQRLRWEMLGPRIVLAVTSESRLPEWYPQLRYTVGHLMAYALQVELAAIAAGADRRTGAVPPLWQDAAWPEVEILLGWRPPQQPCCDTGNTSLFHQIRKAVAVADFVSPAGGPWPQSDVTTPRRTLRAVAQVRRPPTEVEPFSDDAGLAASQVWAAEQVQAMSDLTADVLDMIAICWLPHAKHHEDLVTVTVGQLLALLGLQQHKGGGGRRGGYPRARRREIAQQISILSNIWITVAEMTVIEVVQGARGESRRRVKKRMESRAVVVTSRAGTATTGSDLDADTWRVRPGDVFAPFFLGAGRQTALLARQALEYDPYRQSWEKRLTRYFAWIWRIRRVHEESQQCFQVRTLLAAVAKHPDSRPPRGASKRFEAALDLLREDGVIGAWEYDDDTPRWLERTVLVTPPRRIIEHYARIQRPKKKRPAALPPARS